MTGFHRVIFGKISIQFELCLGVSTISHGADVARSLWGCIKGMFIKWCFYLSSVYYKCFYIRRSLFYELSMEGMSIKVGVHKRGCLL